MVTAAFFVCLWSAHAVAGETEPASDRLLHEVGFFVGYGKGNINEGSYEPILLVIRLGYDMRRIFPILSRHNGTLSVYIEPKINPVISPENDIEFGIGVGVKYMYHCTEQLAAYIFGSVGPHYVTVVTRDQANGFIFSDTIGCGVSWFLNEKSAINLEYRWRHISNADLKMPNNGIDTHIGMIGYSLFF